MKDAKFRLRQQVRSALASMTPEELRTSDDALFARFLALPQVKKAKTFFAFWGVRGREPDTGRLAEQLVSQGKRVALPCTLPQGQMEFRLFISRENLLAGPHGIMEPDRRCPLVPAQAAELILVPALCCDKQGFRLGQGGGFYDRWLSAHSCPSVCLCRQPLLCDALPIEGHDRPVDLVLTELGQWPEGRKGTAISPSP